VTILTATTLVSLGLVGLIWIGYPLCIRLLASVKPRPVVCDHEAGSKRQVTVVLASRERAEVIHERVQNLLDTDHASNLLEIIVTLDRNGSQARADQLVWIDRRVRVVLGDAPGGKAASLNAAVREASGEILVMADSAQRFDRRTIPELVAALEDQRFAAISGALDLGRKRAMLSPVSLYWQMEKWLRYNESLLHSSIGVTGAVYATRRQTWPIIPVGALLDDVFVPMSLVLAGYRVGFCYAARAEDVRTFDVEAEAQRKTRTLTGVLQLQHLLPDILSRANPVIVQYTMHKLARLLTPFLLALGMLSLMLEIAEYARQHPQESLVALGLLLLPFAFSARLRARTMDAWRWALSMQVATVQAVLNGARGRWQVWTR
jgi:cellulose synthase/poly-beta-1,6-N-acetylglucosamine synthase-like glycosyltransferase